MEVNNELTNQHYWEAYYGNRSDSADGIIRICSRYDAYWQKLLDLNAQKKPESLIEIGGYPGRYLTYLASRYELKPTSLDFNPDKEAVEKSFKLFDIKDYEIIQTDFLKYVPEKQYDLVLSNGFIEHFTDFSSVMDRHVDYMKSGGTLMIMIPNMRNYIFGYKYLVDKKNLDIHNTNCMKLSVFRDFASRNSLKIHHLNYHGGFPFTPHQNLNQVQKLIYKTHRLGFKFALDRYLEKRPNRFFSETIVGIFQK